MKFLGSINSLVVVGVLLASVSPNAFSQTLDKPASRSTSNATVHVNAGTGGTGVRQRHTDQTLSVAGGSGVDSSESASGNVSGNTEGFSTDIQVVSASGMIGSLNSHDGGATLTDHIPSFGGPGYGPASFNTTTFGIYHFLRSPPPSGFVWVASGTFHMDVYGVTDGCAARANIVNPAVNLTHFNIWGMGFGGGTVTDVLAGTQTSYSTPPQFGEWSVIVTVGPQAPEFRMTATTTAGTYIAGHSVGGGRSQVVSANGTTALFIDNVQLVPISSLPPLQSIRR